MNIAEFVCVWRRVDWQLTFLRSLLLTALSINAACCQTLGTNHQLIRRHIPEDCSIARLYMGLMWNVLGLFIKNKKWLSLVLVYCWWLTSLKANNEINSKDSDTTKWTVKLMMIMIVRPWWWKKNMSVNRNCTLRRSTNCVWNCVCKPTLKKMMALLQFEVKSYWYNVSTICTYVI